VTNVAQRTPPAVVREAQNRANDDSGQVRILRSMDASLSRMAEETSY
jgi:hypothetical protein